MTSAASATPALRSTTTLRPRTGWPYSFDHSVPPPKLTNRGNDYVAILKSLSAYSAWVDANVGNDSLLLQYAAPGSTFEKSARHDLQILDRLDRRMYETNSAPPQISIVDSDRGVFTARYVQHLVAQTVVDREGRVTSQLKYTESTTTYTIVVAQETNGTWLIADVEPVKADG